MVRLARLETGLSALPLQPASEAIAVSKYLLPGEDLDGLRRRLARALARPEADPGKWEEAFYVVLGHAWPAGRIMANAGAESFKPNTSTINCTVSRTIEDSMRGIMEALSEAALTLKAGCVAPGTWVITDKGLVTADEAVRERHAEILSYDREARRFEMRRINKHLTTVVTREDNIEIVAAGAALRTSVHHPVLVYRHGQLRYVRADGVTTDDALVRHTLPWRADDGSMLEAWFAGAHLGDGSAYEKRFQYSPERNAYRQRAAAFGRRLVFKIRAAEREVVERYAAFFQAFCGSRAQVMAAQTPNGTPVWDYTVASFEASRAAELIGEQIGSKSATLRMPAWIVRNPERHFLPFLAGLIDTDGTVSREHGAVTIGMKNPAFAGELKAMLGLFGVNASITLTKPRTHVYNGNEVRGSGGATLKISDSAFLAVVAHYMVHSGKRARISDCATQAGQYDKYAMPPELSEAIAEQARLLDHRERLRLGIYHGYHRKPVVSRVWLDRWARVFPSLEGLINFARTLRVVERISRGLDLPETFYDFTVERNNNYVAGNGGLVVIHNCGIGYDFTTLRPRGAWVQGAGAATSGPLPFMDVFDAACKTVSSAGGRRGAQMGCLEVSHPDIETFIVAKREAGRLRAFNLSCLITDDFVRAVRNDEPWPLVFPAFADEIGGAEIVWRRWPLADPRYTINERGETACKVYRTLRARELWALIMRSTYEYSDPGFILIDEINRMNPLWFCEGIRATNPCVTGDTWVHTDQGPRQVRELCGSPARLRINGKLHDTNPEGFFRTGTKPVVSLRTKEGYSLRLTSDHRVLRVTRLTRWSRDVEWCTAGALRPGDKLVLNDHRTGADWRGEGSEGEGYLLGLLLGDGTIKKDEAVLSVWRPARAVGSHQAAGVDSGMTTALEYVRRMPYRSDFKGWAEICGRNEFRLSTAALTQLARQFGLANGGKVVTRQIETASSAFYCGFLRGLFDADGSVQGSQQKGVSVRLAQSDARILEAVQRMLLRLGIASAIYRERRNAGTRNLPDGKGGHRDYPTRPQHELVISGANLAEFEAKIGFVDRDKRARLRSLLAAYRRKLNAEHFTAEVSTIETDGKEDVFDVQVPGVNAFDANGFHAHNCGEQPLPPHGACLLGSVNLATFVQAPFTHQARFDFERFAQVVHVFSRMLDNVVEINALPLPEQRVEIERKRRHGLGYFGLGSALTMLGLRYGSPEAVRFTETVSQRLAVESWRAALELAREKGPAPILAEDVEITPALLAQRPELASDGVKAGDKLPGRVLHARYSHHMQRIASLDKGLVNELADVGARYTHATSIAPTGTMAASVGNNASNGIEPSFAHSYIRNLIVPGEKAKRAVCMESYELLAYRTWVDPQVDVRRLPEAFRATATEVDPRAHIDMQAAAQRWIDSSISKTINVPSDIAFERFEDLYRYAIERGLKGCTTFRFNPEVHQGVLVTDAELAGTLYTFQLADGETIEVTGDTVVEYEGARYTAANLYDAIKEGFYGKL